MQQRNDKGGFYVLWWYNIHTKFHECQLVGSQLDRVLAGAHMHARTYEHGRVTSYTYSPFHTPIKEGR
jgi:hypothetical protein